MSNRTTLGTLPNFPYGAVYFRKSNPPSEDWARDYATAQQDGHTLFRHWFLWSAIETEPGVYDWSDYDRQLDLAAEHGIKTIIAEMIAVAPEWAYRAYAHARFKTADGNRINQRMHGSCAVGGGGGLCLDNLDVRNAAERFLQALVTPLPRPPRHGRLRCLERGQLSKRRLLLSGDTRRLPYLAQGQVRRSAHIGCCVATVQLR